MNSEAVVIQEWGSNWLEGQALINWRQYILLRSKKDRA
jgi:hypothetical protein